MKCNVCNETANAAESRMMGVIIITNNSHFSSKHFNDHNLNTQPAHCTK